MKKFALEEIILRKLQQFYQFKFESDRLALFKNKINLTIDEARQTGELVSVGYSQLIRSVHKVRNQEFSQSELDDLLAERKKLSKKVSSPVTIRRLVTINETIDNMLFLPDIISVVIINKSHYLKLIKHFTVNGKKYVRLLAGSGNIRRDTVIWCSEEIYAPLVELLDGGRNLNIKLTPSKYSAYFSLSNTATYSVSYPKFVVIKDCIIKKLIKADYVFEKDNTENDIETKELEIESNLFDGQGLISIEQSEKWSGELELDYIPSCYVIRGPFTKGLLVTFDIHAYCEYYQKYTVTDVWGKTVDLRDIDVIFTESQVKLWAAYNCCDDFVDRCKARDLGYGISRITPKEDKSYVRSNYQFLQVLDLKDWEINELCKDTVEHFVDIAGMDRNKMILYYLNNYNIPIDGNPLKNIQDNLIKALILDPNMQYDPYLRQHIYGSLNKKIKESYIGSLYLHGNYSSMIADPVALMEHCLGLPINGLLQDKIHYSQFWNDANINKVVACRAPLTFTSEVNILNLQNTEEMQKWYKYITTGIIYNGHGIDVLLHADSDFDGDMVFTSSSQQMIDGVQPGLPITYSKKVSPKIDITLEELVKSDINGIHSKIGFITNCSSTVYTMIQGLKKNSPEYIELYKRLKLFRFYQGENIDKAKNGGSKDMPDHWFKYTKTKPPCGDSPPVTNKELETIKFNNSLLIEKRPYFFRYIYRHYNRKYQREIKVYNNYCYAKFGFLLDELLMMDESIMTQEMLNIKLDYYRFSYFIFKPSIMNRICWHMESTIKSYKDILKRDVFNWHNLVLNKYISDADKLSKMISLCDEFSKYKSKSFGGGNNYDYNNLDFFIAHLKNKAIKEISSNIQELASLAVYCTYNVNKGAKEFAWKCFGEGIVDNIIEAKLGFQKNNIQESEAGFKSGAGFKSEAGFTIELPVPDNNGEINYLWKKYTTKKFIIPGDTGEESGKIYS
mgnify:CR=1 FL=1